MEINKYEKGKFYENKGTYIGIVPIKGHKFKCHDADPYFKEYGQKYYYEKILHNQKSI